jgi:hypothetical protein
MTLGAKNRQKGASLINATYKKRNTTEFLVFADRIGFEFFEDRYKYTIK